MFPDMFRQQVGGEHRPFPEPSVNNTVQRGQNGRRGVLSSDVVQNQHVHLFDQILHECPVPGTKELKEVPTFAQLPAAKTSNEEKYSLPIIGNIAAGGLQPGDTIPYYVRANRPLGKDEYVLRVEGKSMEPTIKDGALVIMRKHTIPPVPKVGTIVEYYDERGVTLKKLAKRKNKETGKMDYVLHPLNPEFGDIEPMDGGKISGVYVETLDRWEKA